MFSNHFIINILQHEPVKKIENRSIFGKDNGQKFVAYFFGPLGMDQGTFVNGRPCFSRTRIHQEKLHPKRISAAEQTCITGPMARALLIARDG